MDSAAWIPQVDLFFWYKLNICATSIFFCGYIYHVLYIYIYIYIYTRTLHLDCEIDLQSWCQSSHLLRLQNSPLFRYAIILLLMEEILHHLLLIKSYEHGIFSNWCRIPSIKKYNSSFCYSDSKNINLDLIFQKKKLCNSSPRASKASHPFLLPCFCKCKFHIRVFHGHQPGRLTKKGRKISWTIFEMPFELFGSFPPAMGLSTSFQRTVDFRNQSVAQFLQEHQPFSDHRFRRSFLQCWRELQLQRRWNPMRWQLPSFFNLRSSQNHTSPFGAVKNSCCATQVKAINLSNRISTLNHWSHRDFETTKKFVWNHQTTWTHTHTDTWDCSFLALTTWMGQTWI